MDNDSKSTHDHSTNLGDANEDFTEAVNQWMKRVVAGYTTCGDFIISNIAASLVSDSKVEGYSWLLSIASCIFMYIHNCNCKIYVAILV